VNHDALVWLSPVGWSQATHPVGADARWWPLLVSLAAAVLLVLLAAVLGGLRDVGSGLVAERPGPARASRTLVAPVGRAFRTQRGMLLAWVVGIAALGVTYGSLTDSVEQLARDNPTLEKFLSAAGQGSIVDSFLATMLLVLALLAAAYATASASRLSAEESSGRLEQLMATGLSRPWWLAGSLLVTTLGSAAVLLAGGLGLGVAYGVSVGDAGEGARLAAQQLVYLPAVVLLAALAALLQGWAPQWARATWLVLAVWFVLDYLGPLLDAPAWLVRSSPFAHTPQVPVEAVTLAGPVVIALLALALTALGAVGLRRRDLVL
jgi:ABC-2 type transport system permease protein